MSAFDTPDRPSELDLLDPAHDEASMPPELETHVVAMLRTERLLDRRPRFQRALAWAAVIALAFAAGYWLPRATQPAKASPAAGITAAERAPRFMLLLYEDDGFEAAPAGHEADRVEEYVAWLQELSARGIPTSGDELAPQHVLLGSALANAEADRPPGLVAGYFVIETADFATAQEVASTCPHLRYGGRVAVRPIIDHG